jgi:hypothetical protein
VRRWVVLDRRPRRRITWPTHDHCRVCDVLAEVLIEWTRADPAGVAWWRGGWDGP